MRWAHITSDGKRKFVLARYDGTTLGDDVCDVEYRTDV